MNKVKILLGLLLVFNASYLNAMEEASQSLTTDPGDLPWKLNLSKINLEGKELSHFQFVEVPPKQKNEGNIRGLKKYLQTFDDLHLQMALKEWEVTQTLNIKGTDKPNIAVAALSFLIRSKPESSPVVIYKYFDEEGKILAFQSGRHELKFKHDSLNINGSYKLKYYRNSIKYNLEESSELFFINLLRERLSLFPNKEHPLLKECLAEAVAFPEKLKEINMTVKKERESLYTEPKQKLTSDIDPLLEALHKDNISVDEEIITAEKLAQKLEEISKSIREKKNTLSQASAKESTLFFPFVHSEQCWLTLIENTNFLDLWEEIVGDISSRPDSSEVEFFGDDAVILAVGLHLHSYLDICERCALSIRATLGNKGGPVESLIKVISEGQRNKEPSFYFFASSREPLLNKEQALSKSKGKGKAIQEREAYRRKSNPAFPSKPWEWNVNQEAIHFSSNDPYFVQVPILRYLDLKNKIILKKVFDAPAGNTNSKAFIRFVDAILGLRIERSISLLPYNSYCLPDWKVGTLNSLCQTKNKKWLSVQFHIDNGLDKSNLSNLRERGSLREIEASPENYEEAIIFLNLMTYNLDSKWHKKAFELPAPGIEKFNSKKYILLLLQLPNLPQSLESLELKWLHFFKEGEISNVDVERLKLMEELFGNDFDFLNIFKLDLSEKWQYEEQKYEVSALNSLNT